MERLLRENNAQINNALRATKEAFNPYDTEDMKAVLNKQKKDAMADPTAKNAVLVAENSKLRMHLSFMPVQYRDFVAHHQQTNSTLYQDQRRDPKVITLRSMHLEGGEIVWAPAPMSHPSVQECMRDAIYTTFDQSKVAFDYAFKLRKRFTEDKATKRIPLKETAVTQYNTISSAGPTEWTRTGDNRYHDLGAAESLPLPSGITPVTEQQRLGQQRIT